MNFLQKILVVAIGGALGAIFRFLLNNLFGGMFGSFPFATFFINVTGSFSIGFLLSLTNEKFIFNESWKLFLTVGFLGAYTTFSTFEFETFTLVKEKNLYMAILYVSLSFSVGLFGILTGVWLAKKF